MKLKTRKLRTRSKKYHRNFTKKRCNTCKYRRGKARGKGKM